MRHRTSTQSPTITSPAMTQRGVILGTAAYMSPEQAKGRAADKRSDIWAFGCVLYEMLTGQRAFDGEDVTDTLGAVVLAKEPDWSALASPNPDCGQTASSPMSGEGRRQRLAGRYRDARLEIDEASALPAGASAEPMATPLEVSQSGGA